MRMYSGWAITYESFLKSDCVTLFDQGCVMWGRGRRDAATQVRSGSFYFIPLNNCRQSGESLHWRNVFQFLWATNEVLWSDILSWALGWSSNVAKEWRGRKISIHNMRDWHRVLSVCLGRGRSRAGGRSPPSTRFSEVIQTFLCFRLSFLSCHIHMHRSQQAQILHVGEFLGSYLSFRGISGHHVSDDHGQRWFC